MILYAEDWKRYPGAIADYQTKNRSFVTFAATLHELGVKNCLFPLALHDQRLQGVDPRSPTLTTEQKLWINREIKVNPWYFLREVALLPVQGKDGDIVKANRGIIAMWWCCLNNFDVFSIQPRQTGKSVGADLLHVYMVMYYQYNADSILLTKDSKLVVKNTQRLKKIRDLLPAYTWVPTKKDKDVEDQFNCASRKTVLVLACAQKDPKSAENQGRGFTTARLHADELPFLRYAHITIPAASAGMDAASKIAEENGEPYGRLYTTTPGDLSTEEGAYAYALFNNGCPFTEDFYDQANRDAMVSVAFKNTGLPTTRISMAFTHRMLGISDEEMWKRINNVPSTPEAINKDYFLIWGKGGKSTIIPIDILNDMDKSVKQPDYNELTETGYIIKWYIPRETIAQYMKENTLLLGVDTSDQVGRDSTACVLINPVNLKVIASISIKNATIISATKWLAKFMAKYTNVVLMIEKKSSAQTFIDAVITALCAEGLNPFRRMWNQAVDNPSAHKNVHQLVMKTGKGGGSLIEWLAMENRKLFGFNQTYNTRLLLYSQVLQEAASQSRHVIHDAGIVNQVARLRITEEGKVDHQAGEHDDLVMAWLLPHWLLRFGRNLDYYGIDPKRVMFNVSTDGKQLTEDDMEEINNIKVLTEELEDLLAQYAKTDNFSVKLRLEHQINLLNKKLTKYGKEPMTIDAVRKEHQTNRRHKWISRR